jgi:hypothetical protein
VIASLDRAADDGDAGEGDNIDPDGDVENVIGGAGDDTLTGDAAANRLVGGLGDDELDGGLGADHLAGGDGEDVADYSTRTSAIDVSLDGRPDDGNADDGPAGVRDDVASDVEDIWGGAGNDTLSGGDGDSHRGGATQDRHGSCGPARHQRQAVDLRRSARDPAASHPTLVDKQHSGACAGERHDRRPRRGRCAYRRSRADSPQVFARRWSSRSPSGR